jgi:ABC-type sugar transport system ATPase subunit
LEIDTSAKIKNLSVAQQQVVQIARALANRCHILIMDEPTAALSHRETDTLMENIRRLRASGTTILYISHRIREVKEIADRVAVLRDGRLITVQPNVDMNDDDITQAMIGRPLKEFLSPHDSYTAANKVVLEARGLSSRHHFQDVSFELREGEILGFAGLVGAGRSEVCHSLFGFLKLDAGEIWIDGAKAHIHSPVDAIRCGIGFVPEERKRQGLFLLLNVMENISIPFVKRFQRLAALSRRNEQRVAADLSQQLHIRTPSLDQPVRFLSGGNQQKVILARWLGSGARIMIMDEPTRGIDVNSKAEIHTLISDIAAQGKSVIVVSSEAQELMALADRIIVMREGRVVGEVDPKTTTEEQVLRMAMWGQQPQEAQPANGLQTQPI